MKTHSLSIVVGTRACNANCPYCVSRMTCDQPLPVEINWSRFHTACRITEHARDGLATVMLTGQGEPTLWPSQISSYLSHLAGYDFPIIELQTNGILVSKQMEEYESWRDHGLSLVSLSIAHADPLLSKNLMGIKGDYNFWTAVERLHTLGFSVRLNCTLLRSGLHAPRDFDHLVCRCRSEGVEQLTVREVTYPNCPRDSDVFEYVKKEKPEGAMQKLALHLELHGATALIGLPHGGVIYDYDGQNVCLGNCLTGTTDPNDIRQIIFYPDGRIGYDWRYPGARIL